MKLQDTENTNTHCISQISTLAYFHAYTDYETGRMQGSCNSKHASPKTRQFVMRYTPINIVTVIV